MLTGNMSSWRTEGMRFLFYSIGNVKTDPQPTPSAHPILLLRSGFG